MSTADLVLLTAIVVALSVLIGLLVRGEHNARKGSGYHREDPDIAADREAFRREVWGDDYR